MTTTKTTAKKKKVSEKIDTGTMHAIADMISSRHVHLMTETTNEEEEEEEKDEKVRITQIGLPCPCLPYSFQQESRAPRFLLGEAK